MEDTTKLSSEPCPSALLHVRELGVGDTVRWTSQANGSNREKTGTIVCLVPAGEYPDIAAKKAGLIGCGLKYKFMFDGCCPRKEESYLVSVQDTKKGMPKLYWPRAANLSVVAEQYTVTMNSDGLAFTNSLPFWRPATT